MNWRINCTDDRGTCGDFHEGLCMARVFEKPKKISCLHKCPYGNVEDVIWEKNGIRYQHNKQGRIMQTRPGVPMA